MKDRKRLALWGMVLVFLLLRVIPVLGEEKQNQISDARYGVVRIFTVAQTPEGTLLSTGTGFGVGEPGKEADTFVTNWHVVTSSGAFDYRDARVFILLDDQTVYKYEWEKVEEGEKIDESGEYGEDENGGIYKRILADWELGNAVECQVVYAENQYPDVAILQTKEPVENVETMVLRRVNPYDVGRKVYTIGYPSSADMGSTVYDGNTIIEKIKGSVEAVSVAGGDISRCLSLELVGDTDCIVHHAHINHGNSGGPLILEDGSVIGINTYGYGEIDMEYSVSIYIDYAIEILDELGISYTLAEDGFPFWILFGAGAVVLAGAGVFVVAGKRKKADASDQTDVKVTDNDIPVSDIRLQGVTGVFAGRRFQLKAEIRMGRDPQRCDFVYPADTKGISGMHCVICVQEATVMIMDTGSTHGTFINGNKLMPNRSYPLAVGDKISLGSVNEEFQITKKGGAV